MSTHERDTNESPKKSQIRLLSDMFMNGRAEEDGTSLDKELGKIEGETPLLIDES